MPAQPLRRPFPPRRVLRPVLHRSLSVGCGCPLGALPHAIPLAFTAAPSARGVDDQSTCGDVWAPESSRRTNSGDPGGGWGRRKEACINTLPSTFSQQKHPLHDKLALRWGACNYKSAVTRNHSPNEPHGSRKTIQPQTCKSRCSASLCI